MNVLIPIGEFSRLTHLTVKTLRHYHDLGLLVPAEVDGHTGYRRYGTGQADQALLIGRLRGLDMPLAGIRRLLAAAAPADRDAVLAEHLRRMEGELDRTREIVSSLRELLAPAAALTVEYRTLPALDVLAVRDQVGRETIEDWCRAAFGRLHGSLRGSASGRLGRRHLRRGVLHRRHPVTCSRYLPVRPDAPVESVRLPGGRFAVALHSRAVLHAGPHVRRARRARRRARRGGGRPGPGDLPGRPPPHGRRHRPPNPGLLARHLHDPRDAAAEAMRHVGGTRLGVRGPFGKALVMSGGEREVRVGDHGSDLGSDDRAGGRAARAGPRGGRAAPAPGRLPRGRAVVGVLRRGGRRLRDLVRHGLRR